MTLEEARERAKVLLATGSFVAGMTGAGFLPDADDEKQVQQVVAALLAEPS